MTTEPKPHPTTGATPQPPPRVRSFLLAAVILTVLGWSGLYAILNYTEPSGGTRWAFFFFGVTALTGIMLPITAYLNRRFPSTPPATTWVVLRQALWVGIYIPTLLWLRLAHLASFSLALLLAAGLILIEWLLRLRERSQWRPGGGQR